jgi:hypothetical protein
LLKPFSSDSSAASTPEANDDTANNDRPLLILDDDLEAEEVDLTSNLDDADDNIDELEMLSHVNHERMLDDTAAVKGTIAKVSVSDLYRILANINMADLWSVFCGDSFNDSLAPGMACGASHLKEKLMLRDVATRWNSTYDMLVFALQYQVPIDRVTSDKSLKRAKKI